ncbi:unnamed protein product [Closterium sp. NIES-53]
MGPVYVESVVRHYPNHAVFSPADASTASLFAKREGPLPPGRVLKPGRCYHLVRKAQGKGGVTGGAECAHADEGGTAGRKPPRDLRKTPSANGRNERNLSPPSAHPHSAVPPLVHVPARSPPRVTIFVRPRHRVNHSTSALPDVSPDASPPHARISAAAPAPFATGAHSPAHADGGASRRRAGETGGMAPNGKTGQSHAREALRAGLVASPARLMVPALRRSRRGMHRPCKSLSGSPEEIGGLAEEAWGGDEDGGKAGDGRWRSAHVTPLGSAHATPHVSPYGSAHVSPLRGALPISYSKAPAPLCESALRPRTPGGEWGREKGAAAQAGAWAGAGAGAGSSPLTRSHGRRHSSGGGVGGVAALDAVEALIGAQRVLGMAEADRGRGNGEEGGGEMRGEGKGEQGWAEALVERMRQLSPLRGRSPLWGRSPKGGRSPTSQRVHAADSSNSMGSSGNMGGMSGVGSMGGMGVGAEGQRSPDLARPPSAVPRRSSFSPPRMAPGSSFSPPCMAFDQGEHAWQQHPEPRPPMLHPPTPVLFLTRPAHSSSPPPSQRCTASATPSQHSPPHAATPSHSSAPHGDAHGCHHGASMTPCPVSPRTVNDEEGRGATTGQYRSPPHGDAHGRYHGASMSPCSVSPRSVSPCPVSDEEGRGEMDTEMWCDGDGREWVRHGEQGQQGQQQGQQEQQRKQLQQGQHRGREEARSEVKCKARDKGNEGDKLKQGSGSEGRGRERSPLRRLLHAISLDSKGSEADNPKEDGSGHGQEGRGQDRSPMRRLLHAISLDAPSRPGRPRRAVDDSMVGSSSGKAVHGTPGGAAAEDVEWQAAVAAFRRRVEVLNGECLFNWSTVTAGKEERRAVMWKPDLPDVQEASDAGSFAAPITRHKRTLSAHITSWLS